MNITEKHIRESIDQQTKEPSVAWQGTALKALKEMAEKDQTKTAEEKLSQYSVVNESIPPLSGEVRRGYQGNLLINRFSSFLKTKTTKISVGVIAVFVCILGFSSLFFSKSSEEIIQAHLAKADEALVQLTIYSGGGIPTPVAEETPTLSLISRAYAAESEDEKIAEELIEVLFEETEKAVKETQNITDSTAAREILENINEIQDTTIDTLFEVVEVSDSENISRNSSQVIRSTAQRNKEIETAQKNVSTAIASGEEKVVLSFDKKEKKEKSIPLTLEEITQKYKALNLEEERRLHPEMEEKIDILERRINDCWLQSEECSLTKIEALYLSLEAQIENIHRNEAPEEKQKREEVREQILLEQKQQKAVEQKKLEQQRQFRRTPPAQKPQQKKGGGDSKWIFSEWD